MKQFQVFILLTLLCWASVAAAGNRLLLPEGLQIVAANGENISITERTELPDGLNQLAVQFSGDIGRRMDAERVSSDVFVLLFTSRNSRLTLQMPEISKNYHLDRFNENPDIRIIRDNDKTLELQIDKLEKEGFQLFRDYARELEAYNRTKAPAALTSLRPEHGNPREQTQPPKGPEPAVSTAAQRKSNRLAEQPSGVQESMAEQMLKYWYRQADEQTQKRFKDWINP